MKILNILVVVVVTICVSCACVTLGIKPDYRYTYLLYNAKDHTLLISNASSAEHICKVKLDLDKDILSVKVYKKIVSNKPTSIINSATTNWKIKLESNVSFVRFGNKLMHLSELNTYPKGNSYMYSYYPSIEIYPRKFPYVGQ
jgi:hypothetical protein